MFDSLQMAPADPILGLTAAFKEDPNPKKVNLGVGVYKDKKGVTPIFESVKKAEAEILKKTSTKSYLPIDGDPGYASAVQELLFGKDSSIIQSSRAMTAHTPGGTGALRIAGDFLRQKCDKKRIWVSDPTWANHNKIFAAAGLEVQTYPYYNAEEKRLDFEPMMQALAEIPQGDVLLLHGCCHNPTGMDPNHEQWAKIAEVAKERELVLLVDFAYQGLAEGLEEDAAGLRMLAGTGCDMLIASSFSKNFGLYQDRVGALTLLSLSMGETQKAFSHVKVCIRTCYSNPPAHGGAIVTTIINTPALRKEWEGEVADVRERINAMRKMFVEAMASRGVDRDFSFITRQNGMFSFSGLTKEHVEKLRREYAIYIVGSGRINVAGLTADNMGYVCDAIRDVLKG